MNKVTEKRKFTFDDGISLLLFACYATEPFTSKDVQDAVFDFHRTTIYSILQNFVRMNYLERINENYYRATPYAKDIMNAHGGITA